jgi:hypothetical protein
MARLTPALAGAGSPDPAAEAKSETPCGTNSVLTSRRTPPAMYCLTPVFMVFPCRWCRWPASASSLGDAGGVETTRCTGGRATTFRRNRKH